MPWFTGLLLMYCQHVHVDFDMKFASILLNVETFNMLFCGKANMSMLNFRCGARLPFLTKWIKIETISSDLVRYTWDQESYFFHLIHCSPFVLRSTPQNSWHLTHLMAALALISFPLCIISLLWKYIEFPLLSVLRANSSWCRPLIPVLRRLKQWISELSPAWSA